MASSQKTDDGIRNFRLSTPGNRPERDVSAEACDALQDLLQEQASFFLGIIRSYVARMNLARGDEVQSIALAVWQETALEALAHVERFARATQPRAWVLAVAANILKRKRHELTRLARYEMPVSQLMDRAEDMQESAFFEQIVNLAVPGPEQEIEAQEQVREMLSLVSAKDRHVLRLAFLHDMDGQMLAKALAVSPSTARTRLYRALARLREAWARHEEQMKES